MRSEIEIKDAGLAMLAELELSGATSKWAEFARKLATVSAISVEAAICMAQAYRCATSQQIFEN